MIKFFKKYIKEDVQNILIIGAPKSGTTALHYKIKNALGGNNVIEYFEPTDISAVNKKIKKSKKSVTKVVTLEKIKPEDLNNFSKIILISDPRDQFISSMLYECAFHATWNKPDDYIINVYNILASKSESPEKLNCINFWNDHVSHSLTLEEFIKRNKILKELICVEGAFVHHYEDFVSEKVDQLEEYLGFKLVSKINIPDQFKRVIRTKSAESWKQWLTETDLDFFKNNFTSYYKDFQYTDLDWQISNIPIDKRHSSEYYLKLVNDKRQKMKMKPISVQK